MIRFNNRSAVVRGYLKGWLSAKRSDGKLLADVPFRDLHPDYKEMVIKQAYEETRRIRRVAR